jgi:hypothetical protein
MPFPRFSIESRQSKSPKNIDREYSSVFQRRWGAIRSMETAGRPNGANSFICLIEIQAKNVFFRVFASAIGEIFVFPMILKPHFCSTLIDPMLSAATWRKSADLTKGGASY